MKELMTVAMMLLVPTITVGGEMKWTCSYSDKGVQVEFNKKGEPNVSLGKAGMDPFVLSFDPESGEARLVANSTVEVLPLISGPTLSFVEDTASGPNIFTLFVGSPVAGGELIPFAQARHLDLNGSFPQQYFGVCREVQ